MDHTQQSDTTRRKFLAAGASGLALAALAPSFTAAAESPMTDSGKATEKANEALVMQLCNDISAVDPTKLAHLLADDFVFQLIDGQPLIEGKEKFLGFVGAFFAPFERAEFIVHRSHALGNLVINERTDNFYAKEGGKVQSFKVTGFCLVKDGKIKEWKDYALPA